MSQLRQVWRLRKRPAGNIAPGDLEFLTEPMPEIADGEALVQVRYLSMDPANRIRMSDREQYRAPVRIDDVMGGGIAGKVVASRNKALPVGTVVSGWGEWASHVVSTPSTVSKLVQPPGMPLATLYGSLGATGWTAYFGLLDICDPKPGETLVVSAAGGAVGSIVGQIGKIKGCRVIGIAGGAEKCAYVVDEFGFDACIDYHSQNVAAELDRLCPDGVDINFENVGGESMNAVVARMKLFGRMVICGLISTYNDSASATVPNPWERMLMRRLKFQGLVVADYAQQFPAASEQMSQWWADGKLKTKEDIRPGLENAVAVLSELYRGGNRGKLLLEVSPP
jgi:NADPH-dependent curcumin reductase